MGGFLLKKFQLTPKGDILQICFKHYHGFHSICHFFLGAMQFVMVFNATCLALYVLVFFLGCDNVKMAGTTIPYYGRYYKSFQFRF